MPDAVPEGFAPHFRKSKVTDPWEPLFSRALIIADGVHIARANATFRVGT